MIPWWEGHVRGLSTTDALLAKRRQAKWRRWMRDIARGLLFGIALLLVLVVEGTLVNIVLRVVLSQSKWFENYDRDIIQVKMVPTLVYFAFGSILLAGLLAKLYFIKYPISFMFPLRDEGWRLVTLRSGIFFVGLAILNEITWRVFGEMAWVNVKVFGMPLLTILYIVSQIGVPKRYRRTASEEKPSPPR
jgi:intracellular septation protein A